MLETLGFVNAENWLRYNTHGHVIESSRGLKARCGGTALCARCKCEEQLKLLIEASRKEFEQYKRSDL